MTLKEIEEHIKKMLVDDALDFLNSQEISSAGFKKLKEKLLKKKDENSKEVERFRTLMQFEKNAYESGYKFVAGIDEAGRGPLAGPVVAAAVILPQDCFIEGLDDSKKLSAAKREELYDEIISKALAYKVCLEDNNVIEEINILNATKKAMKDAVVGLEIVPDILLIDAVRIDGLEIEQMPIIQGDAKSASIAAASILAKVTRDRLIENLDSQYPQYGFAKHKGYGTKEHISAIKQHGLCPIHRISFCTNFTAKEI